MSLGSILTYLARFDLKLTYLKLTEGRDFFDPFSPISLKLTYFGRFNLILTYPILTYLRGLEETMGRIRKIPVGNKNYDSDFSTL